MINEVLEYRVINVCIIYVPLALSNVVVYNVQRKSIKPCVFSKEKKTVQLPKAMVINWNICKQLNHSKKLKGIQYQKWHQALKLMCKRNKKRLEQCNNQNRGV